MRQNKVEGWTGRPGPLVYAVLRADAVDVVYGTMEGYEALGIPYMPRFHPRRGGEMTNEKVNVVIVARDIRLRLCVGAGEGRQESGLLETGPDWELSDLISSEIWGRRIKPAGAPILLEGENPRPTRPRGLGGGWRGLALFSNFRDCCRPISDEERAQSRETTGRSPTRTLRHSTTRSRDDTGLSGDAKAEEKCARPAKPTRCRR